MRRRAFMAALGGALTTVWLHPSHGQGAGGLRRVGALFAVPGTDAAAKERIEGFRDGLQRLGWVEGRNVRIDVRWASSQEDQNRLFAKELVGLNPDVLTSSSSPLTRALMNETTSIPIIFSGVVEPISSGFVNGYAHPGGHMTGFSNFEPGITGKWIEILKEVAPRVIRAAALYNPKTAPGGGLIYWRALVEAAASINFNVFQKTVSDATEIELAIADIAGRDDTGLIIMPDFFNTINAQLIASQAARHRVPAIYHYRSMMTAGGLVSYGNDLEEQYRRQVPSYIDRVLKGERPGDLPVQGPTKFELIVNLKAAKLMGLEISASFLLRADEVLE